jgi:tetratricopeptide (TPR) repeat protein
MLKFLRAKISPFFGKPLTGVELRRFSLFFFILAAVTGCLAVLNSNDLSLWLLFILLAFAGIGCRLMVSHVEARQLVRQAHLLSLIGRNTEALRCVNTALEMVPDLAIGYAVRSEVYATAGQIDMAADDAERAVKIAPRYPEARLARARMYTRYGLHEDAIHDLNVGLQERPDWAVGYLEIAQIYMKIAQYENSLAALESLSRRPVPPSTRYEAMLLTGWLYEDRLKDLDKAIAAYTRAIPLLPDRKIAYMRRAFAYRSRGDNRQAAEDLLRAAQRKATPEDIGRYHWLRAVCYGRRFTLTNDDRDLNLWVRALEASIAADAPKYAEQSERALEALRASLAPAPEFPPRIRVCLN